LKVPFGSLASWREPPPQPATAKATATGATSAERLIVDPLISRATYHAGRKPSRDSGGTGHDAPPDPAARRPARKIIRCCGLSRRWHKVYAGAASAGVAWVLPEE